MSTINPSNAETRQTPPAAPTARGPRGARRTVLTHAALIVLSVIFIIPFLWLLSTSLKPESLIFRYPPVWIPHKWQWSNYVEGLTFVPYFRYLLNTTIIAVLNVIGAVVSCSLVAYGLARIRWPGRDTLLIVLLATIMLPGQVTMVPLFVIFKHLHWIDTWMPLWAPSFLGNAFLIFLLRQFFMTIPTSLTDAARLDGCSEFDIYRRVVIPLSKPALATVGLFAFMNAWNDYLGPLIYLFNDQKYTLSLGLANFLSQYGSYWGPLMAASTVMTVPIIILFFFAQRTFIQGISLTGIKG